MDEETVTYERMGGVDAGHGHKFEWEMTTLAYLRCQRLHEQWKIDNRNGIKSFSVANNVKGAGKFDDILIRLEYVVDSIVKNKVIFVQCKHIEDPCKNSEKKFQTLLAETKPLSDLFKSFVNIEQCKEQVLNESSYNKPANKKQQLDQQDHNNLQSFFKSKNLGTEFVFCSNIAIAPDFQIGIYKVCTEVSDKNDITNILFNNANTPTFELRLKESVDAISSLGNVVEQNSFSKQFHEKFRVFINQPEPETLIYKELQFHTKTSLDTKYLQTVITEEIRSHFTSKIPCTALTEKSDTVSTVVNFMLIRTKSTAIMKDFCDNFGIKNIFSLETTLEFQKQLEQNKIINIKTDFQKLELIKVKQVFNLIPTESTCLFLHSETDIEDWISARETTHYSNLKMVYIYYQTNVNFERIKIKHNEVIVQIAESSKQQNTLLEYLQQFSNESRNYILNSKLLSQGVKLDIKSFCGESWEKLFDENIICDILQNKFIELYKTLPDLGFYITRRFHSETLDQEKMKRKMLGWKSVNNVFILFSENDKRVPGCETTYKIFGNMHDVRTYVKEFRSKLHDTYHLCSYCDNELKLIYSFGKSKALTDEKTVPQDSLLNNKHTRIRIISDVAGMGKSTTLLALAELDKRNNPSHLIFFIELNKYLRQLKDAKYLSSTDTAIDFVGRNILELRKVEFRVFFNACNESGKVALYFDAFDEISPDAEKPFSLLLLTLERTKICKIFVSSRPNYVHVLEKTMLQKSMQFLGLTDEEKELALVALWKELLIREQRKVNKSVLEGTAKEILNLLHKEGQYLNNILAIPLQIRMLATIYYDSLEEGQIAELSTVNLSDFYEQFICLHARRLYVEKYQIRWNTMTNERNRRSIEERMRGAEELACQSVIPELLEYNDAKMCNVLSFLCDELGLITNKNPPVFLHRTIAEYLAAKYVLKKMYKFDEEETLSSILREERFNIVRKFINSLLVGNSVELFFKKERYQWGKNYKGNNPLQVASLEGNVEIMIFLLQSDQSLMNQKNFDGQTAIHIACKNSKPEAVKLLLTYPDCSVNILDRFENTPLHAATEGGSTIIMEMILVYDKSLLNKRNKLQKTPIHRACEMKNEAAVKYLLSNNDCLVNLHDCVKNTVLHIAAQNLSPEVVDMILSRNKDLLNEKNKSLETPLHRACKEKNEAAAKFLLGIPDCLVNVCDCQGYTVLHRAACYHSPEIIELILRRDKSLLNKQNKRGEVPLHVAFKCANTEVLNCLLSQSECVVDICDIDGNTVLHINNYTHFLSDYCDEINVILQHKNAPINKQNKNGESPLHSIIRRRNNDEAKLLLAHTDCSVNICDKSNQTVLHDAILMERFELVQIILQRENVPINQQNKEGKTPLHIAASTIHQVMNSQLFRERLKAVELLIEHPGCSIDITDNNGLTAYDIAKENGQQEIIEIFWLKDGAEHGNRTVEEDNTHSEQSVTTVDDSKQ